MYDLPRYSIYFFDSGKKSTLSGQISSHFRSETKSQDEFHKTMVKSNYLDEQLENINYPKKRNILRSMGIFDFRDPSKRKKKIDMIRIQCNPKELRINESLISFPTDYNTLKKILGDATRIEPIKNTKNNVYLWDELGIYCSSPDPEKMLMLLLVIDARYGLGHQPTKNFTGSVDIDGQDIATSLNNVDLDRPYMIRSIHKENKQVAIALGWNPGA